MSLKDELKTIEEQIKTLERRRAEIYRASLTATEEHKVCEDWVAEALGEEPLPRFQFPIEVHGITWSDEPMLMPALFAQGVTWVAVRPVSSKDSDGKRTLLGFLLGDLARGASARFDRESGVISIAPSMHNPAIWVPDLGRIVMGCESWWGAIKDPEDLRKITDADINDAWYVRALRDLSKAKEAHSAP